VVHGDLVIEAVWVEEVRAILRDADASAWRAERADDLRRRVRDVVSLVRAKLGTPTGASSLPSVDRAHALAATMERALPEESTRARWSAFVGEVHPSYEALVAELPTGTAVVAVRPTNYSRSVFHCGSAAVGLFSVAFIPSRAIILGIAVTFATYAWSMEIGRRFSPRMNAWLMRMYSRVSHPHERYKVNSATWFATALVLLALFSSRPATMAALAVLGVADPVAALVGRRWGKHLLRAGRSLEGTLGFIVSGSIVAALALLLAGGLAASQVIGLALLAGVTGALAELVATRVDDNLTIPLAVGTALTAAGVFLV
jgi:dolichol kinase